MQFQEASFEETSMALDQQGRHDPRSREQDSKLVVMFTNKPWMDRAESAKAGRPIYVEKPYVMIMVPGDKDSIIDRPASQMDIDRFPTQYQRFLNKQDQKFGSGTPLTAVSFLTQAQAKELEFFNVYSVEQLANIPDVHAQKFMGFYRLKQLAEDFLKASREQAPLTAMREEMERKDAQLAAQQTAIDELKQQVKQLMEDRTTEGA